MSSIIIRDEIKGSLTDVATLSGELSCSEQLAGTMSATESLSAEITIPILVGGVEYAGSYEITPLAYESQVLNTANKVCTDDITVLEVPYYQTSNEYGDTIYIASEV